MVQRHLLAEGRVHLHEHPPGTWGRVWKQNSLPYVFKTRICPHSETMERVDVDRGHEQLLKDEVKSQRSRTVEHPCKE